MGMIRCSKSSKPLTWLFLSSALATVKATVSETAENRSTSVRCRMITEFQLTEFQLTELQLLGGSNELSRAAEQRGKFLALSTF